MYIFNYFFQKEHSKALQKTKNFGGLTTPLDPLLRRACFIEEETILMNDSLFSREALADYHTKLEHPVRQRWVKNYPIKAEDENEKDVRGSLEDNSSKCNMSNGRHDRDECKAFSDMAIDEGSKLLSKENLCYGFYEVISPKHTIRNCPRRRNCKICLAKHPTGLHG